MKRILCSRCNKNNAEVFMTSIVNGKKVEEVLCLECALQKEEVNIMLKQDPQFQQLIEQAIKMKRMEFNKLVGENQLSEASQTAELELLEDCPVCGADIEQIRATGLSGCSNCYSVFEQEMDRLLEIRRVTGTYKGRTPKNVSQQVSGQSTASQLIVLRQRLQESINKEEYEQASLIKEQIVKLEKR